MTTIILFKPLTARGGRYYYLQFTEEETEAQTVGIWRSHLSLLTPMPALGGQGRLPNTRGWPKLELFARSMPAVSFTILKANLREK